ncbi:DNA mismatch repair endonuclease MutL [Jutongia huaianensis]|uniref:DNA mismatch repair protein MutL n=1 Tax=Jutongia huaianensis TaxID=2763668 RepID=A0ABR7MZG0_9FIRM|nr:DNA mismatch repair endonuclease MutL [Jutongia huaianensis]MBC8561761.1 DNA mismatch repair endonuclease MutL [Jutongia huaianensis]
MSKIHVLNQDTINKIAAGEVIERPMAVVKELTENAIDADANAITVEVKDGGKALIRMTDNGVGMNEEDVRLAFTPHATSKIDDAEDLLRVSTLGFRGEALASISSVSQLEMVTKTRNELMGCRYEADGGKERTLEAVGCPDGTTILVRNLFFNTPARLKFLKSSPTEAGYINTLIERLALSHPDISFRFINQNQTKLHTSGNGNLKDVIYHIYGKDITSNLLEVDASEVSCQVKGFIGKPIISRGNRNYMNYFINGRYIKSSTIHKAIEDAYQPYTMQHRYPFTVLHFTVAPELVDINVHPQKMEIRFSDAQGIYQSVYHAISEALKHREFIPEVSLASPASQPVPKKGQATAKPVREPEMFEKKRMQSVQILEEIKKQDEILKQQGIMRESAVYGKQDRADASKIMDDVSDMESTKAAGNAVPNIRQTEEAVSTAPNIGQTEEAVSTAPNIGQVEIVENIVQNTEHTKEVKYNVHNPVQESFFDKGILSEQAQKEVKIIGQVFDTYWILQYDNAMYMVDQHAAHEKVLYERFMKQFSEKKPMVQLLQPPVVLTLTMQEEQAVKEHMSVFEELGYQIEPFGGREYVVNGVPAHLPQIGNEELLKEVIDAMVDEHSRPTPDILKDKIASMSCKAAVKGNNRLPREQMEELLRELMTLENPYHCPHGRPTMIKMTKTELDKKFKRIV